MPKTWIFFFIIVVVLIIASLLQPPTKSHVKSAPSQTAVDQNLPASREDNATSMLKKGNNTIFVADQASGQQNMHIDYVVFQKPGFITIREDDHGMPGKIIGVSEKLNGRVDGPNVHLSANLEPDHVYYAELVTDDGDGVFEEAKDFAVNDQDKEVVLMSFLAKSQGVSTAP